MRQQKAQVINKVALVLLSIIVLELVLIADVVQPVKGIKKKIYLKKFKKLLPLLALVKPKKKIILLPIPIPMFKPPMDMSMHQMDSYDMPMDSGYGGGQMSMGGGGGYSSGESSSYGGGGGGGSSSQYGGGQSGGGGSY